MLLINVTLAPAAVTTGLLVIAVGLLLVAVVPDPLPVPVLPELAAADAGAVDSFRLDAGPAGVGAVCVGGREGAPSAGLVGGVGFPGVASADPVAATGQTVV